LTTEAIVALEPDLVLAGGITDPAQVDAMEALGLTVYTTHNAQSLDDIYADIRAVGQLVGEAEAAESLVAEMQTRVAAVTDKTGTAEKLVVFYELDATDPGKPWTPGPNTFISDLISMAGGINAGDIADIDYAQLSLEQLVAQNPAVILLGSATYGGQTPEMVAQRAGWGALAAVQSGAVHAFDDNLLSRPGPRVVDGLETLARLIHPELFS
jgi:iron complex transport system substrate-binding protein